MRSQSDLGMRHSSQVPWFGLAAVLLAVIAGLWFAIAPAYATVTPTGTTTQSMIERHGSMALLPLLTGVLITGAIALLEARYSLLVWLPIVVLTGLVVYGLASVGFPFVPALLAAVAAGVHASGWHRNR